MQPTKKAAEVIDLTLDDDRSSSSLSSSSSSSSSNSSKQVTFASLNRARPVDEPVDAKVAYVIDTCQIFYTCGSGKLQVKRKTFFKLDAARNEYENCTQRAGAAQAKHVALQRSIVQGQDYMSLLIKQNGDRSISPQHVDTPAAISDLTVTRVDLETDRYCQVIGTDEMNALIHKYKNLKTLSIQNPVKSIIDLLPQCKKLQELIIDNTYIHDAMQHRFEQASLYFSPDVVPALLECKALTTLILRNVDSKTLSVANSLLAKHPTLKTVESEWNRVQTVQLTPYMKVKLSYGVITESLEGNTLTVEELVTNNVEQLEKSVASAEKDTKVKACRAAMHIHHTGNTEAISMSSFTRRAKPPEVIQKVVLNIAKTSAKVAVVESYMSRHEEWPKLEELILIGCDEITDDIINKLKLSNNATFKVIKK